MQEGAGKSPVGDRLHEGLMPAQPLDISRPVFNTGVHAPPTSANGFKRRTSA